jgi:uncharacterized membrane protein YkvA (DUF1232 family)
MNHLDTLEAWLASLPDDIRCFSAIAADESIPAGARRIAAGVINYLFKSIDLIPDGIDDIGTIDDVMTLRLGAALIKAEEVERSQPEAGRTLGHLAEEASVVREILGADLHERFARYTSALKTMSSRGRGAQDVVDNAQMLHEMIVEVGSFCTGYTIPSFEKSERTLIKLRAFLDTRLPR